VTGKQQTLFDPEGGRADAIAGMAATTARAGDWVDLAHSAVRYLVRVGKPFSSEDVTAIVGLPHTGSPNAVGAVISNAARQGIIVRVGDTQAKRRNQHATRIGLWQGVGK